MIIPSFIIKWTLIILSIVMMFMSIVRFANELKLIGEDPEANNLKKDEMSFFQWFWRSILVEGMLFASAMSVLYYYCMVYNSNYIMFALLLGIVHIILRCELIFFMWIDLLVILYIFITAYLYYHLYFAQEKPNRRESSPGTSPSRLDL